MGGWGSGPRGGSAPLVESLSKIDLAELERRGLNVPGDQISVASALVELTRTGLRLYYWASEADYTNQLVPFVYTAAQFGGRRRWLSCPRCGRRCRVIYHHVRRYRCRKCFGLAYRSTQQSWHERVLDQADKLALRIAGANGALYDRDDFPDKPKRMRWTTYWRLEEKYYRYMEAWGTGFAKRFGIEL